MPEDRILYVVVTLTLCALLSMYLSIHETSGLWDEIASSIQDYYFLLEAKVDSIFCGDSVGDDQMKK
jgi:hypothetical protein